MAYADFDSVLWEEGNTFRTWSSPTEAGLATQHSLLSDPLANSGVYARNLGVSLNSVPFVGSYGGGNLLVPVAVGGFGGALDEVPSTRSVSIRSFVRVSNFELVDGNSGGTDAGLYTKGQSIIPEVGSGRQAERFGGYKLSLGLVTTTTGGVYTTSYGSFELRVRSDLNGPNNTTAVLSTCSGTYLQNIWYNLRMDVVFAGDRDVIRAYVGTGLVGFETWDQVNEVEINVVASGYRAWGAGYGRTGFYTAQGTVGNTLYSSSRQSYFDRFRGLVADL